LKDSSFTYIIVRPTAFFKSLGGQVEIACSEMLGSEPKFLKVPIEIMDFVIGVLDSVAKIFPSVGEAAEFGKTGSDKKTPSYVKHTLEDFFKKASREGIAGQELGEEF
ncbi:unnamed protein product, partial [Brassica rapa]